MERMIFSEDSQTLAAWQGWRLTTLKTLGTQHQWRKLRLSSSPPLLQNSYRKDGSDGSGFRFWFGSCGLLASILWRAGRNNELNSLWPKMARLGPPFWPPKSPRKSLCRSPFFRGFEKGLATDKPPKRAQKVLQKYVHLLLRGRRKKGTEKSSPWISGLSRASSRQPPLSANPFSKLLIFAFSSQEMRHINFYSGGPKWGSRAGAKKFVLEKFMCFFCPLTV